MSRKTMYNTIMEVKRLKVSGQDDVGGTVQVKTTIYQVACRLRKIFQSESSVGGKDGTVSTHRVSCQDIDIRPRDEIIISRKIFDVNTINPGSALKGSLEVDVTYRG